MVKGFSDLILEVQDQGKCVHCGGCVTFCSAINYGALKLDPGGRPVYDDREKCLECGFCYTICPQTSELDEDLRLSTGWQPPMGRVIRVGVARARDAQIRETATDGGVVTAVLTYLWDTGRIDGAIVSQNTDFGKVPCLATTREAILASAGTHFGSSQGMVRFSEEYATFSPSLQGLSGLRHAGPARLAFVGTSCQINTIRKMQTLNILPSDAIHYCLGLFCSGNFSFTGPFFSWLEKEYGFTREEIRKINIKEDMMFSLSSGRTLNIPIGELDPVRRSACRYCEDFSAEYADISFGGLGSEDGWTTIVTRSAAGEDLFIRALDSTVESYRFEDNPKYVTRAEEKILDFSNRKREKAIFNRGCRDTAQIT